MIWVLAPCTRDHNTFDWRGWVAAMGRHTGGACWWWVLRRGVVQRMGGCAHGRQAGQQTDRRARPLTGHASHLLWLPVPPVQAIPGAPLPPRDMVQHILQLIRRPRALMRALVRNAAYA